MVYPEVIWCIGLPRSCGHKTVGYFFIKIICKITNCFKMTWKKMKKEASEILANCGESASDRKSYGNLSNLGPLVRCFIQGFNECSVKFLLVYSRVSAQSFPSRPVIWMIREDKVWKWSVGQTGSRFFSLICHIEIQHLWPAAAPLPFYWLRSIRVFKTPCQLLPCDSSQTNPLIQPWKYKNVPLLCSF